MRTPVRALLAFGLLALALGQAAAAAQSPITAAARAALLKQARYVAAQNGDRHPYDIQAVLTSHLRAIRLKPGTTEPNCESMASCAGAPWYVLAMRGHFRCDACPGPPGHEAPAGNVIILEIEAKEPLPGAVGFAIGFYPNLRAAGVPVRLDPPRRRRRAH